MPEFGVGGPFPGGRLPGGYRGGGIESLKDLLPFLPPPLRFLVGLGVGYAAVESHLRPSKTAIAQELWDWIKKQAVAGGPDALPPNLDQILRDLEAAEERRAGDRPGPVEMLPMWLADP